MRRLIWVGSRGGYERPPAGAYVAYPAILRRVVVTRPAADASEPNPFERAVIGLLAAGVSSQQEIGELLGIHDQQFVGHIIGELRTKKRVTAGRRLELSDQGLSEATGSSQLREEVWYVAQDAYSGALWGRATLRISPVDRLVDGRRHRAELGTEGVPQQLPYWELKWPGAQHQPPTGDAIRGAVVDHLQAAKRARNKIERKGFTHIPRPSRYSKAVQLDARLLPGFDEEAHILIRVSHSSNEHDTSVMVNDPFELAPVPQISHSVLERMREDDNFRAFIERRARPSAGEEAFELGQLEARDRLYQALLLAISQTMETDLVVGSDSSDCARLLRARLKRLGFHPVEALGLVPEELLAVDEGAIGDLLQLLYIWAERCTDEVGCEVARRAPHLAEIAVELSRPSRHSVTASQLKAVISALTAGRSNPEGSTPIVEEA